MSLSFLCPRPDTTGGLRNTFPTRLHVRPFASVASQPEIEIVGVKQIQQKKKLEKAVLVDSLLRSYGFSDAQISKLQTLRPRALTLNPQEILLPKFEFLRSIGVSAADLPKIISLNPAILEISLQGRLVPCYNFFKSLNLTDQHIVTMLKNYWKIFHGDERKVLGPKIEVLKGLGVPHPAISLLLVHYPSVVHLSFNTFRRCVDEAIQMGFDPSVGHFVQAVKALSRFAKKQDIEHVMDVYRRWGVSDDEILLVFRSQPLCMDCSEQKIMRTMDFLVNQMKWQPDAVVRWPTVLRYSLEKRIMPRCRVIKALIANSLVEENISFGSFISISERLFLDRYVDNWLKVLPRLMGIYRGEESGIPHQFDLKRLGD
ncbi:transcription termination factor MTERF2, chloroplastic-like [Coffea eugenioides]|uniref:Transcription termination factor MTERF8, chloroplastic-like n=1 Tax=Coffea arabica TaxID=13443 RepID=A0A6P6V5N9_COFAR|nr:transcription termination factor MTERF2, chloroplastic-like [Coffea arabica]XP_027161982.1 transcription termination factor MTERF2, chloroplastic-like [Coffea eugenioides]